MGFLVNDLDEGLLVVHVVLEQEITVHTVQLQVGDDVIEVGLGQELQVVLVPILHRIGVSLEDVLLLESLPEFLVEAGGGLFLDGLEHLF